jgi:hypothetical protein
MAEGQYWLERETDEILNELDKNNNEYEQVQQKLDQVHQDIAPDPKPHHLYDENHGDAHRHTFLRGTMSTDKNRFSRMDYVFVKG